MGRRSKLPAGWLRRAQEKRAAQSSRFAGRGPVSNLPVPGGDAERITPEEWKAEQS